MISIVFPFAIGGGRVVDTRDESRIVRTRLMMLLGTMSGERVMRGSWGLDMLNHVEAIGGTHMEVVEEAIRDAFVQWFPRYELVTVRATKELGNGTNFTGVEVRYKKPNSDMIDTALVAVPVQDGTVVHGGEVEYR